MVASFAAGETANLNFATRERTMPRVLRRLLKKSLALLIGIVVAVLFLLSKGRPLDTIIFVTASGVFGAVLFSLLDEVARFFDADFD